jgi:hypothetical protein
MIGKKFSKLTVIADAGVVNRVHYYLCKCECGNDAKVRHGNLTSGNTRTCGCGKRYTMPPEYFHLVGTPIHRAYVAMKNRCYNKNANGYKYWGGRGIYVCKEWRYDFIAFHTWACANGHAKGLSLDRIDNDGPYSPENCRWIPRGMQNRNKRSNVWITAFGETKLLEHWAQDSRCTVCVQALRNRLANRPPERAITDPLRYK